MSNLEGKVAVVTGASRGIGRAIALALAEDGADLALCARGRSGLEETAALVRERGRRAECVELDLASASSIEDGIREVYARLERIDVLVCNAGVTQDTLLPRMSEQQWDTVLDVNLKGTFLLLKAVSKPMMKQRSGSIVTVSSVVGLMGNAGQANYAASKAGLIGLTKSVARELAKRNIRVNCVAPGFVETAMTEELGEDVREVAKATIPLGRFGRPEEIAGVVSFLAGDGASYMTGQVVTVSGGMLM